MHLNKDGTSSASKIKVVNSFGKGNDDMELSSMGPSFGCGVGPREVRNSTTDRRSSLSCF